MASKYPLTESSSIGKYDKAPSLTIFGPATPINLRSERVDFNDFIK